MFNVVVGNPPYMQLNKSVLAKMYKNSQYTVFDKIGNLYCLFYVRGIELLKEEGYLAYVTANTWMKSRFGNFLRQYFLKYNVVKLIDFGGDIFEDAKVDTNIIIIQKIQTILIIHCVVITNMIKQILHVKNFLKMVQFGLYVSQI